MDDMNIHILQELKDDLSSDTRKPVFGVSDQLRHKPACTVTEKGYKLELLDLKRRGFVLQCSHGHWKTWKMEKKNPCMEKSWNLKNDEK